MKNVAINIAFIFIVVGSMALADAARAAVARRFKRKQQ
jgi:hypothetical protein